MAERRKRGLGPLLLARFDGALLRPPAPPAPGAAAAAAPAAALATPPGAALRDWCHAPGRPLGVAELAGRGATALADALALHLDGSLRLQACRGTVAKLALRLRVKRDDLALALGRAPARDDCWDSGWLIDGAVAGRLPLWQPRRATLLLAADRSAAARAAVQAALAGPTAGPLQRPVRLLWVAEGSGPLQLCTAD